MAMAIKIIKKKKNCSTIIANNRKYVIITNTPTTATMESKML